jgi:S-DNA-T family DNA segregation ATPase FtsK/SpoIIIE
VLLAARAESVPIVEVSDVQRQPWGWQCVVRVDEGTPEAIIAKAGDLETKFDLPTNGVRPQPLRARRACAILRLVEGNPFASAPGLPYRAPKSLSITDRFRIGTSVGGDPLEISLAGVMGLWVAASGGGKTGILQSLAEGTTACYDNITIDCDPHGDGLEDLGDAVRITARSNEQIEAVLLFFLVMSKVRARLRKKFGMGKTWKPSAERPAVTIFIDEFPKLSDLAKLLAFDLLIVGRKELIQVQYASQGATTRYLGENIAQMMALKGVGPCKVGDARAVFGDDAVREGYLPHKLSPATDTDPKDAGHIFIQGVPGMADEPIEYAIHEADSAALRKLAQERAEAGLLEPDQDSLDGMRNVDLPEYTEPEYDKDGDIKKPAPVELLTWDQLLRLCGAQPVERGPLEDGAPRQAVEDALAVMEKANVDRMKTETLLAAVQEYDLDVYGLMTAEEFKALMKKAGAGAPITLGPIGEEKSPRGFKRDRLRHLL